MAALIRPSFRSRIALVSLLLAAPCLARAEGEAVRLAHRGKAGDVYKYQVTVHAKGEIDMGSSPDPILQDVTRVSVIAQKFLGVGKDGTLRMEARLISGKKTDVQPDKTTTETLPAFNVVFDVAPDGAKWTAKALPLPVEKGKPKPLSASAINAALKNAADFLIGYPLPSRLLRVGDTWAGIEPKNPYNTAIAEDKDVPFTAKLAAVETHGGVPCAKVIYTLAFKGYVGSFRASILKTAPEGSDMLGDSDISETVTVYYTLDRGAILDSETKGKVKYKYKVGLKVEGQEDLRVIDLDGEQTLESHTTALTFPPYDAALRAK